MRKNWTIFLGVFIPLVLLVIGCFCLLGGVGAYKYLTSQPAPVVEIASPVAKTPGWEAPTASPPAANRETAIPTLPVAVLGAPPASTALDNLQILEKAVVPVNDPIDLAHRLEHKDNIPRSLEFPVTYQIGAQQSYWVTNTDSNQNFQVKASLRFISDHVYFWIQDGVSFNQRDLENLVNTFEKKIYPTDREFFGSEWTPGVDADPHLYILYAGGLGSSLAGYFSSADEYLPALRQDANGHEMFVLNADTAKLSDSYTYGVLAHEFQHMIHWYRDRNEETWMNEGFSDLAMLLNGYSIGGADQEYASNPDIQLTDWPVDPSNRTAHYGASFLFLDYFLDRFGNDATKALVGDPANGMDSIDQVLASLGKTDSLTGKTLGADDVFADWVVASYIHDGKVADGRYTYHNYPQAPKPSDTETIRSCPLGAVQRDVSQYGVDYIHVTCTGDYKIHFQAPTQVGLLPVQPHSGSYAFFSNRGDESDMTLTKTFDFTQSTGTLTFSYWTWYDIEKDYDYAYLTASLDGDHWQILTTPSGTNKNPSGNSYGWGYNDKSGGGPAWIQEHVDISQFAGKKVQLRFEYITDAAVNGEGFLVDDLAVPETGYMTDLEKDDGGWVGSGFVRVQNILPQTFRMTLISKGVATTVKDIQLDDSNAADIPIHLGGDVKDVVLVVSGTARFTLQKAGYQLSIQSLP